MKSYPEFIRQPCNAVSLETSVRGSDQPEIEGYMFENADGSQLVMWQCLQGGKAEMHKHDYDEYCLIVEGTFKGIVGDKEVVMNAGDEGVIPAGVLHGGEMSPNYRSIDIFAGQRFKRS